MEQNKLAKPVLPPNAKNPLAKPAPGQQKVYDIPTSNQPSVISNQPQQPSNKPKARVPQPQRINQPIENIINPAVTQPLQNPIRDRTMIVNPEIAEQVPQSLIEDEILPEDIPLTDFEENSGAYVDPSVIQQRIRAMEQVRTESRLNQRVKEFTKPRPLNNDSLKYLVLAGGLSAIIYLIMRIL